jgi:putative nucleotidyltransferase with HDIG domain
MSREIKQLLYSISALVEMGQEATSSGKDFKKKVRSVLLLVMGTLLARKGAVFLYDNVTGTITPATRKGFEGLPRNLKVDLDGMKAHKNEPVNISKPGNGLNCPELHLRLHGAGVLLFIPLWARTGFVGALALGDKFTDEPYNAKDLDLLRVIANQIAIMVHNHALFTELAERLQENKNLYDEMRLIYHDTVQAFAAAIDAKDLYTKNHSYRVAKYVVAIAKELGWNEMDTEGIYIAGLMHDVGKIVISDQLLNKQTPFTPEEITEIKRHPMLSYKILSKIKFPWKDIVDTIRHHHERLDGKGYPDALVDKGLSEGAKILTLADSFDAMTQDRPYRKKLDLHVALKELTRCLGTQFDPKIIAAFCSVLEKEIHGHLPEPDILPHLGKDFDPSVITSMLEAIRMELQAS